MRALRERSEEEHRQRLIELSTAALVPYMEDRARASYFARLENASALPHNPTMEEQRAENERARDFLASLSY